MMPFPFTWIQIEHVVGFPQRLWQELGLQAERKISTKPDFPVMGRTQGQAVWQCQQRRFTRNFTQQEKKNKKTTPLTSASRVSLRASMALTRPTLLKSPWAASSASPCPRRRRYLAGTSRCSSFSNRSFRACSSINESVSFINFFRLQRLH